jgi:NDP-4-keto-2,6-dideoxyhexose 3-C-methyltransferase
MQMYSKTKQCRICGNEHLINVLDLGEQMLTGIFPKERNASVTTGPLRLVKCAGGDEVCGLLQLEHSYDLGEMYGENYGYRSGLNASMVAHLHRKVKDIYNTVPIKSGDLIIDIGSNDSTTLQAYSTPGIDLIGIDPTGVKFHTYYPPHIQLIPEFFSAKLLRERFPGRKAKVVTSFSMFYDLERPIDFMRDIHEVLADDGIWVFEQSYMPTMLKMNSYDTVCHEHLEYYALRQIKWMTDRVGFRILDVQLNDVNGGSFSVTVTKADPKKPVSKQVLAILEQEKADGLDTLLPYHQFADRIAEAKNQLLSFISRARVENKKVVALGASTKGNVILQYCKLSKADIAYVGEVNSEKFGCYTPGTWIPIIPEDEVLSMKPDYLIILPWHFNKFFLESKKFSGYSLVSPLPEVTVLT